MNDKTGLSPNPLARLFSVPKVKLDFTIHFRPINHVQSTGHVAQKICVHAQAFLRLDPWAGMKLTSSSLIVPHRIYNT